MKSYLKALKYFYSIAFLLALATFLNAQTTTWTGANSSNWFDTENWTNGVPDATFEVTVTDGISVSNTPAIEAGEVAEAKFVEIISVGKLTIEEEGELLIDGSDKEGLFNQGDVFNRGRIFVSNTTEEGIKNEGFFQNQEEGTILIGEVGTDGIVNSSGTFSNSGLLIIGIFGEIPEKGIVNLSTFNNHSFALIAVSGQFFNDSDFVNDGFLGVANSLLEPFSGDPHENTGTLTNNGVVYFLGLPDGPKIPNINDNGIVIAPTLANDCQTITPDITFNPPIQSILSIEGIFLDDEGNTSAGSYDPVTNVFIASPILPQDTNILFLKIDSIGTGASNFLPLIFVNQNCCAAPMAKCKTTPLEIVLNGSTAKVLPIDIDDGSTADCGFPPGGGLSLDDTTSFTCIAVGTPQTVTLRVTDDRGQRDECTATVNILDDEAPVAVCPVSIPDVVLDGNGSGMLPPNIGDGSSTDNCTIIETSPALMLSCADVGQQSVILTASDGYNSDQIPCFFNVLENAEADCCPTSNIIFVDSNTPNDNDGSDWENAFAELQEALFVASFCANVTEIWVADGQYFPDKGPGLNLGDREASFVLQNEVSIFGGFAGGEASLSERDYTVNESILSGDIGISNNNTDNSYHVVYNKGGGIDASAVLDGFVISYGKADGLGDNEKGGGMFNENASPTIKNCTFSYNHADFSGGGIYNQTSAALIEKCDFEYNSADVGAGVSNSTDASSIISQCVFENNMATDFGGGIFNNTALLCGIYNSFFENNSAEDDGGGIHNLDSSPDIVNCAFLGNTANEGAAIANQSDSDPLILNCSMQGNHATKFGGGIRNRTGTVPLITNCIVWGNTAGEAGDEISNAVPGPIVSFSIIKQPTGTFPGIGNINADPLFVSTNDLRIHSCNSPAINSGDDTANSTLFDLDDNPRKIGMIDMGAFEFQVDLTVPNVWNGEGRDDFWSNPNNWSEKVVPIPCVDVLIPTGNTVIVPSNFEGLGKTLEVEIGTDLITDPLSELHIGN